MSRTLRRALIAGAIVSTLAMATAVRAADAPSLRENGGKLYFSKAVPAYKTSWDHYQALKAKARGGSRKTFAQLPDWGGLWERDRRLKGWGYAFDLDEDPEGPPSAPLNPEYLAKYRKKMEDFKKGVEWDNLSLCLPAGFPRWLTEPRPREFILRPEQVWLSTEQQSEFRRVYTDGRPHVPDDEAYPLWEGDSIGFWDGDTLVVHTTNLKDGQYQRQQPDYTDQVTTVEEIRRTGPNRIEDRVTVYDPGALTRPWTTIQSFHRVTDPPTLRINMWSCNENNNVVKTADGTSTFILPGEPGYKDPGKLGKAPDGQ
ncbi:MAG: hypothetical protein ACXU82_13860 [Caulobacteraceae bacterium]